MTDCSDGPTSVDLIHAIAYARQQVAYLKCQDSEIVNTVCNSNPSGNLPAGGGTCIKWKQDESQAYFSKPVNYYRHTCSTDDDCYMGKCIDGKCSCTSDSDCGNLNCLSDPKDPSDLICGYAPDFVASGNCVFTNKQACLSQGQLPWDCSACGPQGNKPGQCTTVSGAAGGTGPQFPYLEWHEDEQGNGKCVLGNFLLKQWCEYPCTRCIPDSTGKYPTECTSGVNTPGVTDVPPFFYDSSKGSCYITHDYCDHYGLRYTGNSCQKDEDCNKGDFCDLRTGTGKCTGPDTKCYTPTKDKIAQFFVGRTLFYMMQKGKVCEKFTSSRKEEKSELEEIKDDIKQNLSKIPSTVLFLYDPKKITKEKILMKNYAGNNINLYLFEIEKEKAVVGFKPSEIENKYPSLVQHHYDGTISISIDKSDLQGDKNLKRIYLSLGSASWITKSMFWLLNLAEKSKK